MYTVGKRNTEHNILADPARLAELGVEIHRTSRGGDGHHGPGQMKRYPAVHLRESRLGARAYVEGLEDVMIAAAASFGVARLRRVPEMTGVWVGDKKLGAVGVRVSVSTHGAAFNRDPDLRISSTTSSRATRGTRRDESRVGSCANATRETGAKVLHAGCAGVVWRRGRGGVRRGVWVRRRRVDARARRRPGGF